MVYALIWEWVLLLVFGGKVWGNFKYPQEWRLHFWGHLVLFTEQFSFVPFTEKQRLRRSAGCSPNETHCARQKHTFCSFGMEEQFSLLECQSDHWDLNWINIKNKLWYSRQLFLRHLCGSDDAVTEGEFLHVSWNPHERRALPLSWEQRQPDSFYNRILCWGCIKFLKYKKVPRWKYYI